MSNNNNVVISEDMDQDIHVLADALDITYSKFVQDAIQSYIFIISNILYQQHENEVNKNDLELLLKEIKDRKLLETVHLNETDKIKLIINHFAKSNPKLKNILLLFYSVLQDFICDGKPASYISKQFIDNKIR